MKTAGDILAGKGKSVWSVEPDVPVMEALKVMAQKDIGALLVVEKGHPVGIFSERDLARGMVEKSDPVESCAVRDLMTYRVVYVQPKNTLEECMALMTDKRIRHLPVLQGQELVGIISIGDIVKASIAEKEFLISQLENYIAGR